MDGKIKYEFTASMWQYGAPGGWYFVSLPKDLSKEIRENLGWQEEGWGRMKATAQIEDLTWDTAIWFDTKMDTYVLPIKAVIRIKAHLKINEEFGMMVWI